VSTPKEVADRLLWQAQRLLEEVRPPHTLLDDRWAKDIHARVALARELRELAVALDRRRSPEEDE
jgi:hypothetical protein